MNSDGVKIREVDTVSILIVNWNGGRMLADCLESVSRQTWPNVEVIVVDNGSTDDSWNLPYFQRSGWHLERYASNTGFSAANNLAFRLSHGAFVALVNNDVTLAPDWTEKMVQQLKASPRAGSAACRLLQFSQPHLFDSAGVDWCSCGTVIDWKGFPGDWFTGRPHHPFGAVASAAMHRRSALERVGMFREPFFAYYEDTDLAARLQLFGYDCVFVNEAVALHRGSATGGRSGHFRQYQLRRNVEYLYWINMTGCLAWRYLASHLIYELLAFGAMLLRGKGGVFIAAKKDFFKNLAWVKSERQVLQEKLKEAGRWKTAHQELARRVRPLRAVFFDRAKRPTRNSGSGIK